MKISDKLIKMFLVFFVYFFYTMYAGTVFSALGINNTILVNFSADILFMVFIIFMYKDNLKEDIKSLKEMKFKKIILTILLWVVLIFAFNMICGIIIELLAPGYDSDSNTAAVYNLFSISTWYTIFKTMIFATLAEEILYRESIKDNVNNKVLFVVISAIIYTALNFVFSGIPESHILVALLNNFLPAIFFSIAYLKNKDNILLLALIKFAYNLIPLSILLLGV